eukprot:Nitzschia sp. Nitz4//scaffold29_size155292//30663//33935//NITZ4_002642-RA/size155292-augustus-gene-0.220-mRNA-1//-1//CDS//3329546400//8966//frame0
MPSLFDLIDERHWKAALAFVKQAPSSIYERSPSREGRLPIHELCRTNAESQHPVPEDGDISDYERSVSSATPTEGSDRIELLKLMIETSHGMGEVSIPCVCLDDNDLPMLSSSSSTPHTSVLTVRDIAGLTPLHYLCDLWFDARWIHFIFSSASRQTGAPTILELLEAPSVTGVTPLHILVTRKKCPFSIFQQFIAYCEPDIDWNPMTVPTITGCTPLHWAFRYGASPRRIKELLKFGVAGLRARNNADADPFDIFVAGFLDRRLVHTQRNLPSLDVLAKDMPLEMARDFWLLFAPYLQVLPIQADAPPEPELNLHRMAMSTFPFKGWIVDLALKLHATELTVPDRTGRLAIHWACECNNAIMATKLLEKSPSTASKAASDGRLALHIALAAGAPSFLIASLLKAFPESVHVRDPVTNKMPIMQAVLSPDPDTSIETCHIMLQVDPTLWASTLTEEYPTMSGKIFDLIKQRKWHSAREMVSKDCLCVYERAPGTGRLPIHELCRLEQEMLLVEDGDFSDDEEFGSDNPENDDIQARLDLLKDMIETSHKMGPVSVAPLDPPLPNQMQLDPESSSIHTSVLTVSDRMALTPLHSLCYGWMDSRWLRLLFSTLSSPEAPAGVPIQRLISAPDSNGATPLHYLACSHKCPLSVLRLFMKYCKPMSDGWDATLLKDDDSDNPLHWAFERGLSPRRIQELLRYSHASLSQPNASNCLPFDLFYGSVHLEELWEDMDVADPGLPVQEMEDELRHLFWRRLEAYLRVLPAHHEAPSESMLPIHRVGASLVRMAPMVIDLALSLHSGDLLSPDSTGRLPLHWALETSDTVVASCFLEKEPKSAAVADNNGRLPLHTALAQGGVALYNVVHRLLRENPKSLYIEDPVTGLWPWLLAAVSSNVPLDVCFSLLREDPAMVVPHCGKEA